MTGGRHAWLLPAVLAVVLALPGAAAAEGQSPGTPLLAAVDSSFPPHGMPKPGGGIEGFNIDLLAAISDQLGRPIELVPAEFSTIIPGLLAKHFDLSGAPLTLTPERAKTLLFTEGYLDTDYQFLTRKGSKPIKRLEDLKGLTLGLNKGSVYEAWARDNMATYDFRHEPYVSQSEAVRALLAGRADANLAGNTVAAYAVVKFPQLELGYVVKTGLVWAVAVRPDEVALRNQIDGAIECLKQKGAIAALAVKWFGVQPEPGSTAVTAVAGYGMPNFAGYTTEGYQKPTCK